jgi:ribosomal-protein-alanine N-acetyltransferase
MKVSSIPIVKRKMGSSQPVIRRAEAGDLQSVAAIQAACPEAAHWPVAEYLQYEFTVSIAAGGVAGFLVWRRLAEGECEVLNLAVAPRFRRQGVARRILEPLLDLRGTIFLEVRASNLAARIFYKSMGFQEVTIRSEYYSSPPDAAIVMKFHSC